MKLIITGGGDSKHFHAIDQKFISLLGSRPTMLYIPLATDEENWKNGLDRVTKTFSSISFDAIEMCTDLSELDWDYLNFFDAVYIDGGNTFQLMESIHDTHAYELLYRFLHHGGVINGDSAGAIVLGSHLETAHFGDEGDDNDSEVYSYQGLNILGHWAIHCHYKEDEVEEILDFVNEYGFPVIALHEESSAYICDRIIEVYGESNITIFKNDSITILSPGMTYTI